MGTADHAVLAPQAGLDRESRHLEGALVFALLDIDIHSGRKASIPVHTCAMEHGVAQLWQPGVK